MMQHLACIMDGNRRWIKKHGQPNIGLEGINAAVRVVDWCLQKKIPHLSFFAFSLENFKRAPREIEPLFTLIAHEMTKQITILQEKNIRIRFIGEKERFPGFLRTACAQVEEATQHGILMQVHIFLGYGARQEIVDTTKRIAHAVAAGTIAPDAITPELFESNLWTAGIPDPDLIMRTGHAQRLSNFLLYQAAYAEFFFLDELWPDVSHASLDSALEYYTSCKRNFGR